MAVPCARCGREYDVALFEFGRTIWCACGERVGIRTRERRIDPTDERRFVADAMLGRLARWLRFLGFDCAYDADADDAALVRAALAERRTLLTRDRRLPEQWWIADIYVVHAEHPSRQLSEIVEHFGLAGSFRVLTRCGACNHPLAPADRDAVSQQVPPRVLAQHDRFSRCAACGRVYWEGTHAARIRAVAAGLGGLDAPRIGRE